MSWASPVSTGLPFTVHTVSKRTRFFSGMSSTTFTVVTTVSPILTGALKASACEMYIEPGPGSYMPNTAEM